MRSKGSTVAVFGVDEQTAVAIDVERWLRLARFVLEAEQVARRFGPDAQMSLLFVDEVTIAGLNERFLGAEYPTDVLAFQLDEEPPAGGRRPDQGGRGPGSALEASEPPVLLGDVVVCPSVAARQAQERGVPLEDELGLLVVHGVLHLLNYDHVEPDEAEVMRRREQELLGRFSGLADGD